MVIDKRLYFLMKIARNIASMTEAQRTDALAAVHPDHTVKVAGMVRNIVAKGASNASSS